MRKIKYTKTIRGKRSSKGIDNKKEIDEDLALYLEKTGVSGKKISKIISDINKKEEIKNKSNNHDRVI